ncbi:MAG TPA: hypothetical protein VK919_11865 [Solirubrobacterales bacterium]|nr:hypothetical protein [Solirubrobacterales bacterium]
MRPVNLIPPEQRRGERTPLRTGPLAYVLVVGLALALAAVTAVVLTGNQIAERKAEVATLEVREAEARARAENLNAFAQFASLAEARFETVSSLARSRFDWERVLRELALVLPEDVWLVSLAGTVAPGVTVNGPDVALRSGVEGPALSIVGCGDGQEAVAGFIQALKDIDGVTRVGVASSALPGGSSAAAGDGEDCRTRDFISRFEVVAAFDAVAVEPVAPPSPAPAPEPAPPADGGSGEQPPAQQANNATGEQANDGTGVVSGVAR